jgi:hypothetical protein
MQQPALFAFRFLAATKQVVLKYTTVSCLTTMAFNGETDVSVRKKTRSFEVGRCTLKDAQVELYLFTHIVSDNTESW